MKTTKMSTDKKNSWDVVEVAILASKQGTDGTWERRLERVKKSRHPKLTKAHGHGATDDEETDFVPVQ